MIRPVIRHLLHAWSWCLRYHQLCIRLHCCCCLWHVRHCSVCSITVLSSEIMPDCLIGDTTATQTTTPFAASRSPLPVSPKNLWIFLFQNFSSSIQDQGKSVTVQITDRCAGCTDSGSLDFSPAAFQVRWFCSLCFSHTQSNAGTGR